jgi:hypothetical protein
MRKWKLGSGGRGLFDFLRGEFNRGANVKQMMVSLNKQRVTDTPYKLPDNQTQLFKGLADKDCFRCKGTGISKWRRQGTVADLCRCVEQKLPAFQAALEQERQRFLAEEAKQQQDPPPSDDTLGLLQGPLHVISSPEVVTDTPRPHFTEEPLHGTLNIVTPASPDPMPMEVHHAPDPAPAVTYDSPSVPEVSTGATDGGSWGGDGGSMPDL